MTLLVGRLTLTSPLDIAVVVERRIDMATNPNGFVTPSDMGRGPESYQLRGREAGSGAPAQLTAIVKEGKRIGSVYVLEDSSPALIPEGWYELGSPHIDMPGGAPKRRPWEFPITASLMPFIARQGEDDNIAGADTADSTAEEGFKTVYTPTTSEVVVLQPRTVAGAEKINLPAGDWRLIARVWQVTNSDAKFRWRTTQVGGTTITSGSQVAIGLAGAWVDLDLGVITVADANAGANWYEVTVQGIAGHLGDTWIDRLIIAPA